MVEHVVAHPAETAAALLDTVEIGKTLGRDWIARTGSILTPSQAGNGDRLRWKTRDRENNTVCKDFKEDLPSGVTGGGGDSQVDPGVTGFRKGFSDLMTDRIGRDEEEFLVKAVFSAQICQKIEGSIHSKCPCPSDEAAFPLLIDEPPPNQ
jgi:hypothetical protein